MNTHAHQFKDAAVNEMLEKVRKLQPLIRQHAAQGESERRVPQAVIDALAEAGAFRTSIPKRYGGLESSMRTMLDVSSIIGEADGGTAWVVTLINVCNWAAGLFPVQAQDDIFGANPNARVTGVLAPTATSVKVDDGYRISGKWFYNSGSWHADWAMLGIPIVDEAGEPVDQATAMIPRSDLRLEETWFVAGMSSTGSNCVIAEDVFVPQHRILSMSAALKDDYASEVADRESFYRSAFVPVLVLVLAGPQLGMGVGALDFVLSKAANRPISYTFITAQSESTAFQLQIAEASMLIDGAKLHAYRAADDIDRVAAEGGKLELLSRARVRADAGVVIQNITRAIDILLFAHGAGGFANASPLQRLWRDSAVAARHAVILPQVSFEVYGKALLGVKDQITPLI
jgi:alkylation response protein AidB-like acyl-CoA dehydrogenase